MLQSFSSWQSMSSNQKGNNKQTNKIIYNIPKKCGQVHHAFQQIFSDFKQMNTITLFNFFNDQGLVAMDNENFKNWKSNHTTSNHYCHLPSIIVAMCHSIFLNVSTFIFMCLPTHTHTYIHIHTCVHKSMSYALIIVRTYNLVKEVLTP